MLQAYINSSISPDLGTTLGLNNKNVVGNTDNTVSGSSNTELEVISNTDGTGASTGGSVSGSYVADSNAADLLVQAPGDETVTGSTTTNFALFGASSNVTYSVTNGQGSIFAGGAADSINVYSAGQNSNMAIYSAGNDTVNLNGTGADTVTSEGNASTTVYIGAGTATVSATGASHTQVIFNLNAGGNVDFINASTQAATVFSGTYTVPGAGGTVMKDFVTNHVTAFGGAGGGIFVGGTGGNNSLTEGSGLATLVGGGNGDTLTAAANASTFGSSSYNELFTGQGTETLLATAGSSNNAFNIGLNDVGVGDVTAAGIASSAGSGSNIFEVGSTTSETLTGSQAAGATNIYSFFGDFDAGGSSVTITDFTAANSFILLENSNGSASSDTVNFIGAEQGNANNTAIGLSDGTTIILKGVNYSTSPVTASTLGSGAIFIN